MANIAITSDCNLNCQYCFTQEIYSKNAAAFGHMSPDIFKQSLEFVVRSGIKQIRILGGEPTLHPDFVGFIELASKTGLPIRLFSNGLMDKRVLDFLSHLSDEQITIVLNINSMRQNTFEISPALKNTLEKLNRKILPGINIFQKNVELNHLLDLIRKYELKKKVRLGLAHPCMDLKNRYLMPKNYNDIGRKILQFAEEAQHQFIQIKLDCGFVPCMFPTHDLTQFGLDGDIGLHCEPIPDILPDGSMVSCYPLSSLCKSHIDDVKMLDGARECFNSNRIAYQNIGIFKTCSICDFKRSGTCTGGCTAQKILRFNSCDRKIRSISV